MRGCSRTRIARGADASELERPPNAVAAKRSPGRVRPPDLRHPLPQRPARRSPRACPGLRRRRWPMSSSGRPPAPSPGFRIGRTKNVELFGLIGRKPRAAGAPEKSSWSTPARRSTAGSSIWWRRGSCPGDLHLHSAVLRELQTISDSSDPRRRACGRRGLDAVGELRHAATVEVHLIEDDDGSDVDAVLVRVARERVGASLVTTDHNLSKVAEAVGVPIRRLNDLAAFRLPIGVGDEIEVRLVAQGREVGQAVGHLDDARRWWSRPPASGSARTPRSSFAT